MKLVPSSGYYSVDPGIHYVGYPEEKENSSSDDSGGDEASNYSEEQDEDELHNVDPHAVDRVVDLENEYERYQEREILSNNNKKRRMRHYVDGDRGCLSIINCVLIL